MLNTVFFYNCKLFDLRAVDEHKTLPVDQFELGEGQNGNFIHFTGRANKTYRGKSITIHFEILDSSTVADVEGGWPTPPPPFRPTFTI
jgi:hypothetical protein